MNKGRGFVVVVVVGEVEEEVLRGGLGFFHFWFSFSTWGGGGRGCC